MMNILSLTSKDCNWIGSDCKSLSVLEGQLWCVCVSVWGMYVKNESLLPSLKDKENQDLVVAMNSVVVHSRFVTLLMNYSLKHVTFPSWGESCDVGFP